MAGMTNETWTHSSYVPHYLLRGDPFASRLSREADIVAAFYICIIGIMSATGNGYVLYMTIKRKTKLKPPELMTLNLAIFDFGISAAGLAQQIAIYSATITTFVKNTALLLMSIQIFSHRWLFGWDGCQFYGWAGFFFGCGSLTTMTMVSLDRYFKICHLRYGTWLKRHHAFLCLAFVWLYAGFWATMPLIGWGSYAPEPFGTSCTLNWWLAQSSVSGQSFVMSILFFCLVLPTGIMVFSYVRIICKVKSSAKEISHFDARINHSPNLEIKLTKVAMLICAGFLIAWIPYAVVSVVSAFGEPDSVPIPVSVIPTLLAKSSAMYNPIIYQLVDLKNSCSPSCFKARRHFPKSRFYAISGSLKDTPAPKEAQVEM